jgi:hypothetical protein
MYLFCIRRPQPKAPLISPADRCPKKRAATFFRKVNACPFLINQINQSSALYDFLEARLTTLSEKKNRPYHHEGCEWGARYEVYVHYRCKYM